MYIDGRCMESHGPVHIDGTRQNNLVWSGSAEGQIPVLKVIVINQNYSNLYLSGR